MAGASPNEALKRVDEALEVKATAKLLEQAVADGMLREAEVFTAYSAALAGKLSAEAQALKEQVAEIDAEIARQQAKRTDAMLAYSMIDHAMRARESGQA